MEMMRELYEKVVSNGALQAKFNEILSDAENAGEAATGEKLVAFAKEAGYEVSLDEMRAFFKELTEKGSGELSNTELDMVAGGKSLTGIFHVFTSAASAGLSCVANSAAEEAKHYASEYMGDCKDYFS